MAVYIHTFVISIYSKYKRLSPFFLKEDHAGNKQEVLKGSKDLDGQLYSVKTMEITKMAIIKIIKLSIIASRFSSLVGMRPKRLQKGMRNPFLSAKRILKSPFAYFRILMPCLQKQTLI